MEKHQFDQKGKSYQKYRPAYPQRILEYLAAERIITPESVVADIGSGTGIFTMQLQPLAKTIFAVEPNKDMRRKAEESFEKAANICPVNASAENTGLPSCSVDCVTAAQAFHWFDREAFKSECQRILKTGGKIVLLWNVRDLNSPLIKENAIINAAFCEKYKGFSNGMDFENTQVFDEFFAGNYQEMLFENPVAYDLETFIGRNLSSSFAPGEDQPGFEPYVSALTKLFFRHEAEGIIQYPYLIRCYIGSVAQKNEPPALGPAAHGSGYQGDV